MLKKLEKERERNAVLTPYLNPVNKAILEQIPLLGPKTILRDACEYALASGGKRFRPCLVFMMANALGFGADVTFAALSIEFFHTASLIADDLPAMDDDDQRRGLLSVHKKFGEPVALLASYTLIAAGYEYIAKNTRVIQQSGLPFSDRSDHLCFLALENATYNTGLMGATGGQFLDVYPSNLSLSSLREVIHKKTSSLFEIAFVFGWLFGGGEPSRLPLVKQAASHFGLAFQIADDLGDMAQDLKNNRQVNVANVFGEEVARKMFHEEHHRFLLIIKELGCPTTAFENLIIL